MTKYIITLALALSACCFVPTEANASNMMELIDIDQQQPVINVEDNLIHVSGGNGMTLYIYNITGVCIHQVKIDSTDRRFNFNLPRGCYIIKVGKTTRKVSIK